MSYNLTVVGKFPCLDDKAVLAKNFVSPARNTHTRKVCKQSVVYQMETLYLDKL